MLLLTFEMCLLWQTTSRSVQKYSPFPIQTLHMIVFCLIVVGHTCFLFKYELAFYIRIFLLVTLALDSNSGNDLFHFVACLCVKI